MNNIDVSIIFVNYKTKDLTINAINSVIEKTEGIEYEIFVVDNASNDGSIEAVEQQFNGIDITNSFPQPAHANGDGAPIYIIKSDINGGFGYANNLAIKQANGRYILCLNTDTLLINNAVKVFFDYMEQNSDVGVCGGYLIDKDGQPCNMGGHLPSMQEVLLKFDFLKILKPLHKKYKETFNSQEALLDNNINSIIGADIFFRKSVLDEVGIFDEQFFMYREETDLCKRIIDNGFCVKYVPEAKIIHFEGKSSRNIIISRKRFIKSTTLYYKKHHPKQVWFVILIYLILYLIGWLILRHNESKELLLYIIKGIR